MYDILVSFDEYIFRKSVCNALALALLRKNWVVWAGSQRDGPAVPSIADPAYKKNGFFKKIICS